MEIYDITTGKLNAEKLVFTEILDDKNSTWKPLKGQLAILKNSGVLIIAVENATAEKSVAELKAQGVVLYGPAFVGNND